MFVVEHKYGFMLIINNKAYWSKSSKDADRFESREQADSVAKQNGYTEYTLHEVDDRGRIV